MTWPTTRDTELFEIIDAERDRRIDQLRADRIEL